MGKLLHGVLNVIIVSLFFFFLSFKLSTNVNSQCVPACSGEWFCSTLGSVSECCKCQYGPGSFGPITCCTPGTSSCRTYDVGGCASAPPTSAPPPPTATPTPSCPSLVSAICSKTVLNPGELFTVYCNYGRILDCINVPGCRWAGWSGYYATFECDAPLISGNYSAYCQTGTTVSCSASCNSSYKACDYVVNFVPTSTPIPTNTPPLPTFCALPGTVTGQSPVGTVAACSNMLKFTWIADLSVDHYAIRIDEDPTSTSDPCSSQSTGDTCIDLIYGNSFARTVIPGKNYRWWVYGINSCGWSPLAEKYDIYVPPCPTSTPVPTSTPLPTSTPRPTNTPIPTSTPMPTNTPVPTSTPLPTSTPRPTNTPFPTSTPIPIATPTPDCYYVTDPFCATITPTTTPASTGGTIEGDIQSEKLNFQQLYDTIQSKVGAFKFSSGLTLGAIISALLKYVFPIFGLVLLLMILYGGYMTMLSGGVPEKIAKGRSVLTSAFIGFIIIFAAYWITYAIGRILGISDISNIF